MEKKYCQYYGEGYKWSKTRTAAFTFGAGFTIPSIGFTVSTETGYSHSATLWYQMARGNRGKNLCGTNAVPNGNSRRIVVKSYAFG